MINQFSSIHHHLIKIERDYNPNPNELNLDLLHIA